uniref:Uncharacterized protein n=1 Tax=Anguilla anguilla TaxID=7936 RepID=A0A0E9UY58_ANGAN
MKDECTIRGKSNDSKAKPVFTWTKIKHNQSIKKCIYTKTTQ